MNSESSFGAWIIAGVALLGLVGGFYIWQARSGSNTPILPIVSAPTIDLSTTTQTINTPSGSYTIEQVPVKNPPKAPQIHRPLTITGDFSADQKASITASIKVLEDKLKTNTNDAATWTSLGTFRKIVGDFEGAKQAWEYVALLAPQNTTPLYNLADLYGNFLKQYGTAETYYKKVISIDPTDTNAYRNLFELYNSVYKVGSSAAATILKQGITANPNSIDLHVLLARYYKSQGDTAGAKAEFDTAIASAKSQGNTQLAAQIEEERSGSSQ